MLEYLYVNKYKLFKELKINSLKRVNLIVGKNNVGKSSLLEAILIHLSQDKWFWTIYQFLEDRGEWHKGNFIPRHILNALESLIYHKNEQDQDVSRFYISSGNSKTVFLWNQNIRGEWYLKTHTGENNNEEEIPLSSFANYMLSAPVVSKYRMVRARFPLGNINTLSLNWADIALTEKEDYVIESLKIIDKNIDKISFVDDSLENKKIIVKLKDKPRPVSIGSMGDGIFHILEIILSLVLCENGALLIDEFENGLHWSVQAELWKIIFHLSYKLNIQIFLTPHGRDTLWALQKIALSEGYQNDTRVIKLKHSSKNQTIKAVELDIENVKDVLEQGLEIR